MKARILKPDFRLEFEGSPAVWNELLRPVFGGPEAPPDPVQPAAAAPAPIPAEPPAPPPPARPQPILDASAGPARPAAAPSQAVYASPAPAPFEARQARTWRPPRDAGAGAFHSTDDAQTAPWRRRGGPEPEVKIEPSNDPATLYARLAAMESRRAEKDAVLAAVWFVGKDEREVHEREAEKHLAEHGGPTDIRIRPAFLKHITRTKLLEQGTQSGLVRLSRKGREQVRLLCGV